PAGATGRGGGRRGGARGLRGALRGAARRGRPPRVRRAGAIARLAASGGRLAPRPGERALLHWRKSLWDPDCFFTWLAPKIRFFWTRSFLLVSATCVLAAALLAWGHRQELAGRLAHAPRWETAVLVGLSLLLIGTLHELAHGLTCKHYGGEVHEVGVLLL